MTVRPSNMFIRPNLRRNRSCALQQNGGVDCIDVVPGGSSAFSIRFTSISPQIERFLQIQTAAATNSMVAAAP
jgi:hypothetical protein